MEGRRFYWLIYDSQWQHEISVCELRHERPSGRFSISRGLSASVSFLPSPPPPPSFTRSIFRVVILCSRTPQKRLLRRLSYSRQSKLENIKHLVLEYCRGDPIRTIEWNNGLVRNRQCFLNLVLIVTTILFCCRRGYCIFLRIHEKSEIVSLQDFIFQPIH